jgi:hypothetical protein
VRAVQQALRDTATDRDTERRGMAASEAVPYSNYDPAFGLDRQELVRQDSTQASIRTCWNVAGIPTCGGKWNSDGTRAGDGPIPNYSSVGRKEITIERALRELQWRLLTERTPDGRHYSGLVLPHAGLGTGIADMPVVAHDTYQALLDALEGGWIRTPDQWYFPPFTTNDLTHRGTFLPHCPPGELAAWGDDDPLPPLYDRFGERVEVSKDADAKVPTPEQPLKKRQREAVRAWTGFEPYQASPQELVGARRAVQAGSSDYEQWEQVSADIDHFARQHIAAQRGVYVMPAAYGNFWRDLGQGHEPVDLDGIEAANVSASKKCRLKHCTSGGTVDYRRLVLEGMMYPS